jgi:hypothetical protein
MTGSSGSSCGVLWIDEFGRYVAELLNLYGVAIPARESAALDSQTKNELQAGSFGESNGPEHEERTERRENAPLGWYPSEASKVESPRVLHRLSGDAV